MMAKIGYILMFASLCGMTILICIAGIRNSRED